MQDTGARGAGRAPRHFQVLAAAERPSQAADRECGPAWGSVPAADTVLLAREGSSASGCAVAASVPGPGVAEGQGAGTVPSRRPAAPWSPCVAGDLARARAPLEQTLAPSFAEIKPPGSSPRGDLQGR